MPEIVAKLSPVINNSLFFGTSPKHDDVEFARNAPEQVPSKDSSNQKVLSGSQNRYLLVEGVKHLAGDYTGTEALKYHFSREEIDLGNWGSEQDSPIYWAIHLIGRIAIASSTFDLGLKRMAIHSIASFLYRSKESMYKDTVLLAGMRGAGHNEAGSYELNYIMNQLFGNKKMEPKQFWATRGGKHDEGLNAYGWLLPQSSATWRILEEAALSARQYGFIPTWIRVRKHILSGPGYKFVWVDEDINTNTPFIGLNGIVAGGLLVLPRNYNQHIRQQKSNGKISFEPSIDDKFNVKFTYTGLYTDLQGGSSNYIQLEGLEPPTSYMIYGPDGVTNALGSLMEPQNTPPIQPTTPPPVSGSGGNVSHKSAIRRFIDWLKNLIS